MKKNIRKRLVLTTLALVYFVFFINGSYLHAKAFIRTDILPIRGIETIKTVATRVMTLKLNVTDKAFGANGFDQKDDKDAIQKALNNAKEEIINKTNRTVEVYIPKGTYYLSDMLFIYSNTKLVLDKDTVIIAGMEKNSYSNYILVAAHLNSKNQICDQNDCTHGGYTQWKNIQIEGGTWDCNNSDDKEKEMVGAFLFRHGDRLTIKDLTLKNNAGHTINPSASSNVNISGITIKDAKKSNKEEFCIEAIHLDSAGSGEITAYPVDGTPMKNVIIENCTFDNVNSAIGCHAIYRTAKGATLSSNIKIINNNFVNIRYYCITAIALRDNTIQKNTAIGKNDDNEIGDKKGYAFIYTRNCIGDEVIISQTTTGGANNVSNFENAIVKYDYRVDNYKDEVSNNLYSNEPLQPSFTFVEYISNGANEENIVEKVNIVTNKTQDNGFTLPDNVFTKPGYKLKNWKVTLDDGTGEKEIGIFNPGKYISTKEVRWHHSVYRVYAQWEKLID